MIRITFFALFGELLEYIRKRNTAIQDSIDPEKIGKHHFLVCYQSIAEIFGIAVADVVKNVNIKLL